MAQEQIDLIRRLYEDFNRGGAAAVYGWLDADVAWTNPLDSVDHRTFHGHDGVATWFRDYLYPQFESIVFDPEEFIEVGNGIVVQLRASVRTRGSELEFEVPFAHLIHIRDGKVTELAMFTDRDQAIRAGAKAA